MQQLHHLRISGARRKHQRRLAIPSGRVRVRAGLQELGHDGGIAVGAGERKRRLAVLVRDSGFGIGRSAVARRRPYRPHRLPTPAASSRLAAAH